LKTIDIDSEIYNIGHRVYRHGILTDVFKRQCL
jgi:hypothetical protein